VLVDYLGLSEELHRHLGTQVVIVTYVKYKVDVLLDYLVQLITGDLEHPEVTVLKELGRQIFHHVRHRLVVFLKLIKGDDHVPHKHDDVWVAHVLFIEQELFVFRISKITLREKNPPWTLVSRLKDLNQLQPENANRLHVDLMEGPTVNNLVCVVVKVDDHNVVTSCYFTHVHFRRDRKQLKITD
jgi:hypothetical protein